ncbi:MAG: histidine phosphatase family protein [Gammaproteobacteria bacterium]|nr:histidine phosphatase family protein [Gammaproteobacteria bacterium]MBU1556967.1 histidine phosphatase family protein [Gammaproteobacteria bacterium]MBU2069711.1 histidine phosphatase family protein [Gammaproteobacteria bacterium]MBU2184576.1 histidine phosphatase family protein [Gammaproteobacteria bacterium]MBU2205258.1 histidine phosphatase family protein [Gammaproteobacteria bacterium]
MKNIPKLLLSLAGACLILAGQVNASTVYLVRHAEKLPDGKDPALSQCGLARAKALADYFSDKALNAVYATPYQRTQQTASPVAAAKQLSVTAYDPREPKQLLTQLSALSQPVLIVGHSNTVPQLVSLLSGIEMAALTEQDYNLLYRVDLADQPSVTLMRQAFICDAQAGKP